MLILTRKVGEAILIGDDVTVTVLATAGGQVRIGIDAPQEVQILRPEAKVREPKPDTWGNR